MKTNHSCKQVRTQGSVLVVALTVLAIAALVLGSYLVLVQTQTNSVSRSQTWNSAIAITEAGLEEGLAEVNKGSPSVSSNDNIVSLNGSTIISSAWGWTNSITMDGNWSTFAGGKTSLTRNLSTNGAGVNGYTVTIDVTSGTPTITSAGFVAYSSVLWGANATPQPFLAAYGANTTTTNVIIGRKVQVQTILSPLFSVAVLTRSNFNMNGNNALVDSFDSSNTNYSTTNGQWVATKRKAGGDVATDSGLVGDLSLGNGNIYGHVYTGPGTASTAVQVGTQGAVGDVAWNASNSGIESNYWTGNFNTAIPDVLTPTFSGTSLPAVDTNGNIRLTGGNYITTTDPGKPLIITGPTTLWVQGSFSPAGLTISNGGSLILYIGTANGSGDTLTLSGNGTVNMPGLAANLQMFGLPSLTSIKLSGNAGFIGAIYAPEANVSGKGGGNDNLDASGSLVVNSVSLNGHFNFHYDEGLKNSGASRGWIAKNWTEIPY